MPVQSSNLLQTTSLSKHIMKYHLVIFLIGLVTCPAVNSFQEVFDGSCPSSQVDTVKDFNEEKFEGLWYVIQNYDQPDDCVTRRFERVWPGSLEKLTTVKNIASCSTGHTRTMVTKNNTENEGKYQFRGYPTYNWSNYYFVAIDYDNNYAVIWTCVEDTNKNYQNLMVLSRDWNFDINSSEALNATLAKPPFDRSKLKYIEQKDERCHKPNWCPSPSGDSQGNDSNGNNGRDDTGGNGGSNYAL